MNVVIYDLPERAEDIAIDQHQQGAPLEVVLATAARIAVAEKLREIVAELDELEASGLAPSTNGYLLVQANALDPDGAR